MAISPKIRRNALLIITGLVVAYVRNMVQYRHYSWESIGELLSWWFIHYMAVGIVTAISYVIIKKTEKIFFECKDSEEGLTWEQGIVYTSLTILISAICIFLLAHWVSRGEPDYEW